MDQPSARVPNPAGESHHCCDRVWADDAAQASPHKRELRSISASAAAGATAMAGLVVGMTGGTGI